MEYGNQIVLPLVLRCFALWPAKLAPLFQPMTSKTNTSRDLHITLFVSVVFHDTPLKTALSKIIISSYDSALKLSLSSGV